MSGVDHITIGDANWNNSLQCSMSGVDHSTIGEANWNTSLQCSMSGVDHSTIGRQTGIIHHSVVCQELITSR